MRDDKGRFIKGHSGYKSFLGKTHSSEAIEKNRQAHLGNIAWNKGLNKENNKKIEIISKNIKYTKYLKKLDKNIGYSGLHKWVRQQNGKPVECVYCGVLSWEKKLTWANVSGEYKRDLRDYISLCMSCHHYYDEHGRGNIIRKIFEFDGKQAGKRKELINASAVN